MVASGAWTRPTSSPSPSPTAACPLSGSTRPAPKNSGTRGCGSYRHDAGEQPRSLRRSKSAYLGSGGHLRAIYLRDAAECWLCGMEVPWRKDFHPLAPTRDHVTPKRDGGSDADDNLRLAHKWCNEHRDKTSPDARRAYIGRLLFVPYRPEDEQDDAPASAPVEADFHARWMSPLALAQTLPGKAPLPSASRPKEPKGVKAKRKAGFLVQYRSDGRGIVVVARG